MKNKPAPPFKQLCVITSLTLTGLLSACGGGGGSDGGTETPVVVTPVTPVTDINTEFADYLTALVDGQIIPAYSDMQTQAQSLSDTASTFCALDSQTTDDLTSFQQSWTDFNQSWQSIQWVKIGAVAEDNRLFRLQFWPDSQGKVSEDVDDLLLEQITVTAEFVAAESVTVQGIPALEYLLFPPASSDSLLSADDKEKRCEVTIAIADNLLNISSDMLTDWQASGGDYRAQVIAGTGEFDSVQGAVEELVTNWLEHIEIVEDSKLNEIVGSESPGNPEDAEHYLSDESLISIATNISAILSVYTNDDEKGFDDILVDFLEQNTINDEITGSLDSIALQITALNQDFDSYETALSDTEGREALTALVDEMRILIDLIDVSFTQALDLNLGFNSSDGD